MAETSVIKQGLNAGGLTFFSEFNGWCGGV